ncbi:MAG: DNA mismatch repair protein MutT [Phenylobacterium sp.]|uniref:NUDIX domain-containing protein n=1 Tax=Phenylobacterium sp. TaxID=1871053 RepID=UPI0025CD353D|nr:NUDIX domain-containing protein [Phenylobacterium sp.]MBA4012227.1 DNA mismatch repair protein MutT [Phenylobacterium sp.]
MRSVPQFGDRQAGRSYVDRPAAFGILERNGQIAVVRIEKPDGAAWIDLPGGGVDPGETPEEGVVREFGEEAGLKVVARDSFALADQFFVNTEGEAWNNRSAFFVLDLDGDGVAVKVEDDHTLVWLAPLEAITSLRHDSHAWAVAAWMRR